MAMNATPSLEIMTPELHEFLFGEAIVCGLLGKIFYTYPEREWVQELADEAVFNEIPFGEKHADTIAGMALLCDWSESAKGGMSDEAFYQLSADYTRLFIGPAKVLAPPWESVHVSYTGLTFQEETLDVRKWYARFGLQFEKLHKEPDDHIGIELAFLSHLSGSAVQAIEHEDEKEFKRMMNAQRDFATAHPLKWAPQWCRKLDTESQTNFYRGTALVTYGTLMTIAMLFQLDMK
jgi:TorA maturation chaperone TorD